MLVTGNTSKSAPIFVYQETISPVADALPISKKAPSEAPSSGPTYESI